ncbi:hypothetical protein Hypma_015762 [Hypsizygus marmoreus]|uniref:RRM domain-containing protein n=1 Tax=Hypsizygus marmoreus TaxID=39966 RepID=A0A369K6A1_HYPMA|nr:hypothetical protein Hypma_015762 [Hypsizygus marmoreus]
MPPKSSLRMRTWGTRFDTLPTSPPVSPPSRQAAVAAAASPIAHEPTAPDTMFKRKEEKMPHDASVFVGSLPSTIDQHELTQLLSEHLSEHTEVKNIKVVRDSKGGVCAFVQCEDAASAATLIHTLHSNPPKLFLGRTLRYEPARAFRTLLISYRTPMHHPPTSSVDDHVNAGNHPSKSGPPVELDLPSTMRVWKPRNSKFFTLLYNTEAVDAEQRARNGHGTFETPSLFLQPVAFDAATIRTLAAYFGRLEHMAIYEPFDRIDFEDSTSESASEKWKLYPTPHDAPRTSKMDPRCWEIKWDHRDDCVSALMTLRRVPHLTVTWAHQPPPFGFEQRSPYQNIHSPQLNFAPYPLHVQDRIQPRSNAGLGFGQHTNEDRSITRYHHSTPIARSLFEFPAVSEVDGVSDVGAPESLTEAPREDFLEEESTVTRVAWSDMDFPPLGNSVGQYKVGYGAWTEKKAFKEQAIRSPSLVVSRPNLDSECTTVTESEREKLENGNQGQEIEVPPTPGLGRSPITPKTPGSLFPPTPTSNDGDAQRSVFKDFEGKDLGYYGDLTRNERELDPTTLFVGGLETFGPGAWDEEKVAKFFARFGGLENVKIVRPLNSHAAFAFVKFNNTESPARAVYEEHNRVYEGRAMRVQLRDCNPPRGSWRNNRGRGRFHQHNFGAHRRIQDQSDKPLERPVSPGNRHQDGPTAGSATTSQITAVDEDVGVAESELPAYSEKTLPKVVEESGDDGNAHNPLAVSRSSSPSPEPSFTALDSTQTESYREWYDEPVSSALTPPPSSFGSSASAPLSTPALPYAMTGGFYTPPQWVHPYAQPMPYQMPYLGYPGYPLAGHPIPQAFPRPPGPDVNTAVAPGSWPPVGVFGSYIPYQTQGPRTPSLDPSQSQTLNTRAPLAPTGFIQNEQGTLIAVYQPEALDQYMAGSHVVPPVAPQHPVPNVQNWSQYPPTHAYPFPGPPPNATMPSRPSLPSLPSAATVAWVPNQGFIPQQPTPHISQTPTAHSPTMPFRGGHGDAGGQATTPFRRQAPRRDPPNFHNQGRNNNPRSFGNRNGRGNMNNIGYHGQGESQVNSRQSQMNQSSSEWNQWASGR